MIEADFAVNRPGFDLHAAFSAGPGITALFGPSGSGKTTILNALAGLERPARGKIIVDGTVFFDWQAGLDLPARRRRVGYVFQDALLFPHLSVAQNLRYGSRTSDNFGRIVDLLGLAHLLARQPAKLSGGERQRAAIGRALLASPRLLLMDEPLSSLDISRKHEVMPYIESLRDSFRLPILYVSHAVDEVARLASHVLIVDHGRITASGPPETVLAPHLDGGRFARVSILTATARAYDARYGLTALEHPAGPISIAGQIATDRTIRIAVRATDVTLALDPPSGLSVRTALSGLIASIASNETAVASVDIELIGGQHLTVSVTRKAIDDLQLASGRTVWCLIKTVSIDERWLGSG